MEFLKKLMIVGLALVLVSEASAEISQQALGRILQDKTRLEPDQIEKILRLLETQFELEPGRPVPIRGVLYSNRFNAAAFVDGTDEVLLDATIIDPESGAVIDIDELFVAEYDNHGLVAEIGWRWSITFIPDTGSVSGLHGKTFGEGLFDSFAFGGGAEFVNTEFAWMSDGKESIFNISLIVGLMVPLRMTFPKMSFKLNIERCQFLCMPKDGLKE